MRDTIVEGDVVLVRKIKPLRRILDRPNKKPLPIKRNDILVFNFPEGDSIYSKNPDLNYNENVRRSGTIKALNDTIKYGKVTHLSVINRQPYIKRCVALPGDTFLIKNDTVLTNSLQNEKISTLCFRKRNNNYKKSANYNDSFSNSKKKPYKWIFPHDFEIKWYRRNFGPVVVPCKKMNVELSKKNIAVYSRIIRVYEENQLFIKADSIFINDTFSTHYKFEKDYYFVLGDNRYHSIDSRHWGFLPDDHIIGVGKSKISFKNNGIRFIKGLK